MLPPSSQTTAITLLLISVVLVTVECSHNQVAEGSLNQQGVGESAIVPEAEVSSVVDTTISAATMADGLVQRLEDTSTCGKLNIKVMLPESGFYTQDMTDASATLIKDDVGKERRKNGVTWSVLGQFTRTGPTTVREMVMVPARKTKKLKWPMLKKTALHSFYDKESIDCCGTMSTDKAESIEDCVEICAGQPECRGTSWRAREPSHEHYKKCFFVTFDGGKHWDTEPTGGQLDFDSAVRPQQMIGIPHTDFTVHNARSLKAYAMGVVDALEEIEESDQKGHPSFPQLGQLLRDMARGLPGLGSLPSYPLFITAMQNRFCSLTSNGGVEAYLLNAIASAMSARGGLVSVEDGKASILGLNLGLKTIDMLGELDKLQTSVSTFAANRESVKKEDSDYLTKLGHDGPVTIGAVTNGAASEMTEEEKATRKNEAKALYDWDGNEVSSLPATSAEAPISLAEAQAKEAEASKDKAVGDVVDEILGNGQDASSGASEQEVSSGASSPCSDEKDEKDWGDLGPDNWFFGSKRQGVCHNSAKVTAKMAEERGDLEQDIYDDAKKAAAVTGCNAQEQQWAAAEVVVAVVDRRKDQNLIKSYEDAARTDISATLKFMGLSAQDFKQKKGMLIEAVKTAYQINSATLDLEVLECPMANFLNQL